LKEWCLGGLPRQAPISPSVRKSLNNPRRGFPANWEEKGASKTLISLLSACSRIAKGYERKGYSNTSERTSISEVA